MAVTFTWKERNGAGEGEENTAPNINFGSYDTYNLNTTTYPISRGMNSFSKYIRALFTGSWTEISNIKFWKSAGNYVAEESISAGFNVDYEQPSEDDMRETPYGDEVVPTSEPVEHNLHSAEGEDTIIYGTGVSGYTGYVRLQTQTTSSTPAGTVNQKTFTMQYDEV